MKVIISPAKKMNMDTDTAAYRNMPAFLEKTHILMEQIQKMNYEQCRELWKCNDKLAELNYRRFQEMNLERNLTPALLSYEGIQYQYLSPQVMEEEELEYLEEHLRILSGFYGLLRPFDGVVPYRLEMQAKLQGKGFRSLYEYWGDILAEELFSSDSVVLNLASKEYSRCILGYTQKRKDLQVITCVFGERRGKKVIEKGTYAKMARGEMVRYLAEQKVRVPKAVKDFGRLGYHFCEECSDEKTFVFVQGEPHDK